MNTNITDNHIVEEIKCPSCTKPAKSQILRVKIEGKEPSMISSTTCDHCGLKDSVVFDSSNTATNGNGIKIVCHFDDNEDLQRYIDLQKMANVKFKKNSDVYEYSVGISGTFLVESIIRDSLTELRSIYNIGQENGKSVTYLGNSKVVRGVGLKEQDIESIDSVMDREKVLRVVQMLENILEHPVFDMEIIDHSGDTRVAPKNKKPTELNSEDLESFNDKKVKHSIYTEEEKMRDEKMKELKE